MACSQKQPPQHPTQCVQMVTSTQLPRTNNFRTLTRKNPAPSTDQCMLGSHKQLTHLTRVISRSRQSYLCEIKQWSARHMLSDRTGFDWRLHLLTCRSSERL